MKNKGHEQGDMHPVVEDYQKPMDSYSQADFNKTTEYISRRDHHEEKQSHGIKKQGYQGRYT